MEIPIRAYHFNGIDNYINIPHTSALMLIGVDFTISAWVTHSGINDWDKTIVVKSDGANINNKWIFWYKPFICLQRARFCCYPARPVSKILEVTSIILS